jgi:hypothetical protein
MMKQKRKGQTLLEFVVLFIVLVAAFLAMQNYLRRGVQGSWKKSLEGMGTQYDPAANSQTLHQMTSSATTELNVINEVGGYRTWRVDTMNMSEYKQDTVVINGI